MRVRTCSPRSRQGFRRRGQAGISKPSQENRKFGLWNGSAESSRDPQFLRMYSHSRRDHAKVFGDAARPGFRNLPKKIVNSDYGTDLQSPAEIPNSYACTPIPAEITPRFSATRPGRDFETFPRKS